MSGIYSRFREQYKKNILVSAGAGKCKRAQKQLEDRRVSRTEHFSRQRDLIGLTDGSETPMKAANSRKLRLQKWKEEKQLQKLLKKASEKPVFKCGAVHHKLGSPYSNDLPNVSRIEQNKKASSTLARLEHPRFRQKTAAMKKTSVTDSTKSFAPSNFKFKPPKIRPMVLTEEGPRINPAAGKDVMTKENDSSTSQPQLNPLRRVTRAQTRAYNASVQHHFTGVQSRVRGRKPPQNPDSKGISKIEAPIIESSNTHIVEGSATSKGGIPVVEDMDTEEHPGPSNGDVAEGNATLKQRVEPEAVSCTPVKTQSFPIQYSPFVTKERGSSSRRSHKLADASEQHNRDGVGSSALDSGIIGATEVNQKLGVLYFRSVLDSETKRLQTMCEDWLDIQSSTNDLPSEASDMISVAVGQTQLLLKKKFCQFKGLIDRCEKTVELETTEASVTCSDLSGFWDMVYMQVEDVDLRFSKLQKLKLNNWEEEVNAACVEAKRFVARGSKQVKKVQKPAKSSLRAMIRAARKRKQQIGSSEDVGCVSMNPACTPERGAVSRSGSTPMGSCKSQTSLLQHTLLEQHKRHSRGLSQESSPIIMKVTQIAKFSESAYTPRSYTQTPRKSILKSVTNNLSMPTNTTLNDDDKNVNGESIMTDRHSSVDTKENTMLKLRRSSRIVGRKVRFEDAGDDSPPKGVQPMTPYISRSQRPKQRDSTRISLLGSLDVDDPVIIPAPTGDLICFDSPVPEPCRVTRRSVRLSTQARN